MKAVLWTSLFLLVINSALAEAPATGVASWYGEEHRGRLMANGKAKGQPRSAFDMIIAAIAEANDCIVVTDNEKDFLGIKTINPIRGI